MNGADLTICSHATRWPARRPVEPARLTPHGTCCQMLRHLGLSWACEQPKWPNRPVLATRLPPSRAEGAGWACPWREEIRVGACELDLIATGLPRGDRELLLGRGISQRRVLYDRPSTRAALRAPAAGGLC
jgi:hypothetical protein